MRLLPRTLAGRIGGALILASVAPTCVLGAIAVRGARASLAEAARQSDLGLVSNIAQDLNTLLQESRRSLEVASMQPALQKAGPERTLFLGTLARHEPLFRSVYLLDADGTLVESSGAAPGLRQLRPTSWGGYVTDAYDSDDGTVIVTLIITIRDHALKDVGYLCGDVDLAFVSDVIAQMPVAPTASVIVVDANRRVIASRSPLPADQVATLAAPVIERVNASLEPDVITYDDAGGREWLAAYRNMGVYDEFRGLRWGIVVQQETRDAFALARRTAATTAVVTLIFIAACIFAGRLLTRRFAAHLSRLAAQADRLAEGRALELEPLRDPAMPAEIAELSARFSGMADRIAAQHAALARRGDELEALNRDLQQISELLGNVVRAIPAGIASLDADGRIATANPAFVALAGASDERALAGARLLDHAPRLAELADALARVLANGETFDRTFDHAALPGGRTALRLRVRIAPLRPAGTITGAVVLTEDLSEQARLEATLVRSEKLSSVGVLAAGVAHEINNPLTAIAGYSRLLLERAKSADASRPALETIVGEADRMQVIVRNLLDFAAPRAAESSLVDVNAAAAKILTVMAPQFRKAAIEVETAWTPGLPPVRGDEGRIQQVVVNLARNAIDAIGQGGRVRVATGREGGRVWIEVRDSGPGIARDVLPRVFDPFFTTKGPGRGTGLGLSISYGIAREHGGTIEVESEPGAGATFRLWLPGASELERERGVA